MLAHDGRVAAGELPPLAELVIRHRERQAVVDLCTVRALRSSPSPHFYADCTHEIRPVAVGHRIVLGDHLVVRHAPRPHKVFRVPRPTPSHQRGTDSRPN